MTDNNHTSYLDAMYIVDDNPLGSGEYSKVLRIQDRESKKLLDRILEEQKPYGGLGEELIWRCLKDISAGLQAIHNSDLVHLDLKPENIFVSSTGSLKIGDFGHSGILPFQETDGVEGDRRYMAPELLNGQCGKFSDIFSLGISVYEMQSNRCGEIPGEGQEWHQLRNGLFEFIRGEMNPADLSKADCEGDLVQGSHLCRSTESDLLDLIKEMMRAAHEERPQAAEIFVMTLKRLNMGSSVISDSNDGREGALYELVSAMAEQTPEQTVPEATTEQESQEIEEAGAEEFYQITINLPNKGGKVQVIASPREAIQDVRQSIVESTETCIHSCFSLSFNGTKLNDFMELGDVEGITPDSELDLILNNYTEREARIHVNRLRDLLAGPAKLNINAVGIDPAMSFLSTVSGSIEETPVDNTTYETAPTTVFSKFDLSASSALSDFVPKGLERTPVQCVKSIALSGWNPPPYHLRLRGDLMYLIVTTLEGETVQITSTATGFHVNKSTSNHFDPTPRQDSKAASEHSLIVLLEKVSPMFATNFKKLQEFITRHHMLEVLPVTTAQPAYPWAIQLAPHTFDPTRPSEAYLNYGTDSVDSLRDWNDELQSHRELPRGNLQERVMRDRFLNKINADFADAAVRGAMDVVNGNVVPLNPLESEESHMYVYNNIFFSKGFDGRNTFEKLGGDDAAHVATGKDLEGVRTLNGVDVEGLYTLGTVVVDYKGVRVVAQSIVPGIFRQQEESSIVYGSVDNGPQVKSDEKFHEILGKAGKALHLAEHSVDNGEGKSTNLWTSFDTKGLMGADGRRYLLDLYRLNPVDIEFLENDVAAKDGFPEYPHKLTLMRPELMLLFWEHKLRTWVQERAIEIQKRAEEKKALAGNAEVKEEDAKEEKKEQKSVEEKEENSKETPTSNSEDDVNILDFDLTFNVDAFTSVNTLPESASIKSEQESVVREASKFLREDVIAVLLQDFTAYVVSPIDGGSLTKAMHRRGINMRYLGRIATLAKDSKELGLVHIHYLAMQEMVVRSVKRIIRKALRGLPTTHIPDCISHILNCLLGHELNASPVATLAQDGHAYTKFTPESLRENIQAEVLLRYRFQLPEDFVKNIAKEKKVPLLRDVCLRAGIQVEARDYIFFPTAETTAEATSAVGDATATTTSSKKGSKQNKAEKHHDKQARTVAKSKKRITSFEPSDILTLLPLVKQASTRSSYADEAFEAGKTSLAQGHRQLGLELLLESLALHEQTYGFLHPETARCYQALAMIYYHSDDKEVALEFQRKAVIVSERTLGVDSPEALHNYLNLGLFEHAAGRTLTALKYLKHAIQYWDLIYGKNHPDSSTADNNIAVMLQSLKDFENSCTFFERAKESQELAHGKEHVILANCHHVLAKAYAFKGDFDTAVKSEQTAYDMFHKLVGADDVRTKEADMWLQELKNTAEFTANQALYEKAAQEQHQLQQQQQQQQAMNRATSLSATAAAASSKAALAEAAIRAANADAQVGSKGHLSLNELLDYINNQPKGTSGEGKSGKKAKPSNAKRANKK
ncbi:Intracellular distribution of mitochondria [Mortierella sp. AM989]|nr:Intracellular distribution of mitochondria [Mortierella sp. AM989]